ncbi:alpha-ketoglutarate-dependent dioxygenase AlkB [Catenulispora subtropica]|uniref:Alpha-ketoglutarate-dependent dioxygenase AlkB n=1 Tax=Catenulispora subtropica TaxID=450798 RepID=A0ABN2SX08_9ACTN
MAAADSVPGLLYVEGWLSAGAQESLLAAVDAAQWSTDLRRRVQHYGHRYDYDRRSIASSPVSGFGFASGSGSGSAAAPPLPDWAAELAGRLVGDGFMAQIADQAIVNEYLPGQGISRHVDCVPCFGPVVAAVSLGSACVMDFTRPEDGAKVPVRLSPGSLTVMTGPARYIWRHSIAARKSDPHPAGRQQRGRRVSVTYRTIATGLPAAPLTPPAPTPPRPA